MKKIKLLLSFIKGNKKIYAGALIAIGLSAVFSYTWPIVLKITIDSVIGDVQVSGSAWIKNTISILNVNNSKQENIIYFSAVIVLLTVVSGGFSFLSGRWSAIASEAAAKKMRDELYDHIQRLEYNFHISVQTGDLIQRCTSDVDTVRKFIAMQFVALGRAVFMLSIALPVMFSLSIKMTLFSLPVIPVLTGFSIVFFIRVKKAFAASDKAEGKLSTVLQENLMGIRVVRAFGRERWELDKYDKMNRKYRDLTNKLILLFAGFWSVTDLLSMLQIGLILCAGTVLASKGALTIGILVVFMTYEGMMLWPLRQMGRILSDMGKAIVSLGRIGDILDIPIEDMNSNGQKPHFKGGIEFKNVSFSYGRENNILDNLSFSVKPGMTVAIAGPTGCGKTSLVNLLPVLYNYNKGSIKIDGIELSDIDKRWLRLNIGFVLQEPFLYAKTIKENIGISNKRSTEKEIIQAAATASMHSVILDFKEGYDTTVGERGVTLSGGQKQRLAIARALINKSPFLIFDDSLSSVDAQTDADIRESLQEQNYGATSFIISHRISTLLHADLILVMEDGRIIQSGTHKSLISEEGLYKKIWAIQNLLESELKKEEI